MKVLNEQFTPIQPQGVTVHHDWGRGLGSYPHSCTPNWDDRVLMGLHLCMGKQGRAKHKLKVEVFQTFRFMTRNKEATPTCNSS